MLKELRDLAYDDHAFPIGHNQTISQPTTIINMITLLNPKKGDKIFEAGTGCGFNAAVLSKLCKQVYTMEIIPELVNLSKKNIKNEKIKNITILKGNAYDGYKKESPYDKIMVTAGAKRIPQPLKEQLKEKGVIVIPTGEGIQTMSRCLKKNNQLNCTKHGEYLFVKFIENGKF